MASADEILTSFDEVMHKTLLPTGRVSYHPPSFYDGPDQARPGIERFHSVVTGAEFEVTVRRRTVDATYMNVTVPSMMPPKYEVGLGVRPITPNQLPTLIQRPSHYTVVGTGKTGIDACLWLLNHDVDPSDVTWIAPRDAWLLDRTHIQPGPAFAPIAAEANVARTHLLHTGSSHAGELALLVEDAWQNSGLGRGLTRYALAQASVLGMQTVRVRTQLSNDRMLAICRALGADTVRPDGQLTDVDLMLPAT